MLIKEEEWIILKDLIGKNVKSVLIPRTEDCVSPPVETCLVLSDHEGIVVDSCSREQRAIETPDHYPQMRVRMVDHLPDYPGGSEISLTEYGEIVKSVEVTNEEIRSPRDVATYTKTIHIEFSGHRDVTITRESFRSPSLWVYEKTEPELPSQEDREYVRTSRMRA